MKKSNTFHTLLTACIMALTLMTACQSDDLATGTTQPTTTGPIDQRPLVEHEVSVSLEGAISRVGYTQVGNDLQLSWQTSEELGVYILRSDNSLIYAGKVSSHGTDGDRGERHFYGNISQKSEGEKYLYLHPALNGESQGTSAQGTIDYTTQTGQLGSTAHLNQLIPLVWQEGNAHATNQGYAIHLTLTFNEDPGRISSITLHTTQQGNNGTTPDRVFPKAFSATRLNQPTNSILPAEKTGSMTLATNDAYTDAITLQPTTGTFAATQVGDVWKVEAYLAATSVKNLDVFRTKYNVKIDAENGPFFVNEYLSFPGQQSATSETGLTMLANGKCYNLTRVMSKNVSTTVINDQYKVNSLLGMWNQYGKPYDPFGLICTDDKVPSQLRSNILDQKDAVKTRITSVISSQGTPTFTWQLLEKQRTLTTDGYKQADVSYNNLTITAETEVYVTFVSEYAWSQNLLGYYHYPTANVPSAPGGVLKTIIFPNLSKGGHVPYNRNGVNGGNNINPNGPAQNVGDIADAPLQEFTTVQLLYNKPDGSVSTTFPAGTTIGFMMMRDPQASNSEAGGDNMGGDAEDTHSGYTPRTDNSLINWQAWRLFTNTKWNENNSEWWNMNCKNFFVSGKVVDTAGNVINGLAIYGAKDDPSNNQAYAFSSMLFMVSSSNPSAMTIQVPGALNLGTGELVIAP